MIRLSLNKLGAAVGGVALSLAAQGLAAADPADAAVNTTCSYTQVVSAIHAQSPEAGEELDATPIAQNILQTFLASPPQQREQILQQVAAVPEAAQFVSIVGPVANTCHNYPID